MKLISLLFFFVFFVFAAPGQVPTAQIKIQEKSGFLGMGDPRFIEVQLSNEFMEMPLNDLNVNAGQFYFFVCSPIGDWLFDSDFPEEELEIADDSDVRAGLISLNTKIEKLVSTYGVGRIYRDGISIAIAGRPNVGKSSLMNALLERDRVIVTPYPGTTRDTVEEILQIDGVAVKIIDTAGVREALDPVERIGIERTMEAAAEADITLLVFDGSQELTDDDRNLVKAIKTEESELNIINVINKSDQIEQISISETYGMAEDTIVRLSAKTGDGVADLRKKLAQVIEKKGESLEGGPLLTRERHLEQLKDMTVSVNQAVAALDDGLGREFIAAELAQAGEALSRLTGKAFDEQALDKIFSEFCIGK